ncbi:hypothetical protein AQV86_05055 [Nanohaloarchaea archaeon SG9]|nr:hypothetical protein AQV86_05055 [Nanohaloarchaea archaeon SG9]
MKHSKLKILAGFLGLFVIFTASVAALGLGGLFQSTSGDAALLKLSGTITPTSSGFASSGITPEQVRDLNQKVRNGGYDAVVYEINSGGGSVVASKEIKRAIDNIEVPTVCRFRDISASGGYMIAMGCDRIVADSATITGSIGVTSSYLEYSGAMDKIGVEYVNISAGKYKQVGSPFTNTTEQDKEVLQDMAVDIQDEFIDMVDKNRNLTQAEIEEVQTAKIFLGQEARNLSLVDSLGGRAQAVESAEKLTNKDLQLRELETRQTEGLLSLFLSNTGVGNILADLGLGTGVQTPLSARY